MATVEVCDKCRKELKYASDVQITIYFHPYGNITYKLCTECKNKLAQWLKEKQ